MNASWVLVDCHQCNKCGHLDTRRDGIMAHLALHDREAIPGDTFTESRREWLRKALDAYEAGRLDFEGFVEEVEAL